MRKSTLLVLLSLAAYGVGAGLGILLPQKSAADGTDDSSGKKTRILTPESSDASQKKRDRQICPELKGATPAQFTAAMDEARKLDEREYERQLMLIGIRWVAEDANSFADYILANWENEDDIAEPLLEILILQDKKAYLRICDQLKVEGHPLAEAFADMEEDFQPEPPIDHLTRLNQMASSEEPNYYSIQQSLRELAKSNPTEAAKWLKENPGESAEYWQRCRTLAAGWIQQDPAAALEWARGLEDRDARAMAFDTSIRELANSDVDQALKAFEEAKENGWLERSSSHEDRFSGVGLGALVRALVERDPEEGIRFQIANKLSYEVDISQYLPRDAKAYHALFRKIDAITTYSNGFRIDYNDDPATSLSKIASLGDDPVTQNMLSIAVQQWLTQNPQAAIEAISGLPPALRSVAASQALDSPQAFGSVSEALAFAKENGVDRLGESFAGWAGLQDDNVEALSAVLKQTDNPQLAQSFMSNWASREGNEAVNWFLNEASESEQELVSGAVLQQWTIKDPEAASLWLAKQPDSAAKNQAVLGMAIAVSKEQPAAALAWLATLDDSPDRNRSAYTAYTHLKNQSPSAAEASLSNPQLPANLRNYIENQLRLYDL